MAITRPDSRITMKLKSEIEWELTYTEVRRFLMETDSLNRLAALNLLITHITAEEINMVMESVPTGLSDQLLGHLELIKRSM